MRIQTSVIFAILVVLAWAGNSEAPPLPPNAEPLVVSLRIGPDATKEALSYVAELAEPVDHQPSGDKTYKQIAREKYGVFNNKIKTLMEKFNSRVTSFDAKPQSPVLLPAGPHWKFQTETRVPKGSNVAQELTVRSGYAGKKTLEQFNAVNPKLANNLENLPPGEKVRLPYVASVVSFRLKPEYVSKKGEIEQKLNSLPGIKDARIHTPPRMTPSLTEAHMASLGGTGSGDQAGFWPYRALFGRGNQISWPHVNRAVVAVLDTGIPTKNDEPRFYDRGILWTNTEEVPENGKDDDNNGYVDDIYGVNMLSRDFRGFPEDDNNEGDATYHGTHVAGLLAGVLLPEESRKLVQDSLRLMILKVIEKNGDVDIGAVHEALAYADSYQVNIVNMSFEMDQRSPALEAFLKRQENVLVVVAAGNTQVGTLRGLNLDGQDITKYPAQCSTRFRHLITVAAHDANGKLAPFSNWGENTVDLAAPGVDVESLQPGKTQRLSGTSQATPFVSLAAALLYAAGVRKPAELRQRLLTAADYDPDLKGKVRSAGRLNIAKALAVIDKDVIQLTSGELVAGELLRLDPLQISTLPTPLELSKVRKIIFNYSKENAEKADLIVSSKPSCDPDGLERFEETLDIFPLRIRQSNGTERLVERSQARDLVLRRPVSN